MILNLCLATKDAEWVSKGSFIWHQYKLTWLANESLYQFVPIASYMPEHFDELRVSGPKYDSIRWNWY
jgi:hypothetical protein